jgi:hypothetical protein
MLQPHRKKGSSLNPTDLVKFEWEKKDTENSYEKRKKQAIYAAKRFKIELPKDEEKE